MVVGDELPSPEPLGALQMSRGTNNRAYEYETPDMLVQWLRCLIPAVAKNVQVKLRATQTEYRIQVHVVFDNDCERFLH